MSYLISNSSDSIQAAPQARVRRLQITPWSALRWAVCLLLVKVLLTILYEYRLYFPPDFSAPFLIGRERTFFGVYAPAFYTHIVCGPPAALLCLAQLSGRVLRSRPKLHRTAGQSLLVITLVGLLPSGLVMSFYSRGGTIAAWGFAMHIGLTACFAVAAWRAGSAQRWIPHRIHATRCAILLLSPLMLRVIVGGADIAGFEPTITYQTVVWFSWLVPLLGYELLRRRKHG